MRWIEVAAAAAALAIAAQPCLAADLPSDGSGTRGRLGAFAGIGVSVPLGGGRKPVPRARLQLGAAYNVYDARSGALLRSGRAAGLELGAAKSGAPNFSIAGQEDAELKRKLGLHGTTGYVVIGGVVLLVVLVLRAVAQASPKPGPQPGAF
jgi:hypothetical protein